MKTKLFIKSLQTYMCSARPWSLLAYLRVVVSDIFALAHIPFVRQIVGQKHSVVLFFMVLLFNSSPLSAQNKTVTRLIDNPEPIEQVFINVNLSFIDILYQQYTPELSYAFGAEGGVVTFAGSLDSGSLPDATDLVGALNGRLALMGADTLMRFTACSTSLAQTWYDFTLLILPNNTYSQNNPCSGVERTINLNFPASTGNTATISVWQQKGQDRPPLFPPWPNDSTAIAEPFAFLPPNTAQDNEQLTNWIKKITYIGDAPYTPTDSIVDIVYYNGLGQSKQTVQVGAAANSRRNIVIPVMYDPLGRAIRLHRFHTNLRCRHLCQTGQLVQKPIRQQRTKSLSRERCGGRPAKADKAV